MSDKEKPKQFKCRIPFKPWVIASVGSEKKDSRKRKSIHPDEELTTESGGVSESSFNTEVHSVEKKLDLDNWPQD